MTKYYQNKFAFKKSSIFNKIGKLSFFLFIYIFLISPVGASAYFGAFSDEATLLKATEKNRVENVNRLLEKEVDNSDLNKAFHKAIELGNVDLVKCFIEHGADVNRKGGEHSLIPRKAALNIEKNSQEIVKVLINLGLDKELFLCDAASYGNFDVVKDLLENGVSKDSVNKAFHRALQKGNTKLVKYFMEYGVDLKEKGGCLSLMPRESAITAEKNSLELIKVLIEFGEERELILYDAAHYGNIKIASYLLDNGASVEHYYDDGRTPLCFAAGNGKTEMVSFLLDFGANISVTDDKGKTPLALATFFGHIKTIEKLIERGADLEDKDDQGRTPLFTASVKTNRQALKVLAEAGALVDTVDIYGMTPLMHAAWKGNLAVAKDLIAYKADIEAKTTKVVTFETKRDPDDFRYLSPYDKTSTLPVGSTALTFAKKYNRNSFIKILEKE